MALKYNLESILIDVNQFINIDNERQRYSEHFVTLKDTIFKHLQENEVMKYLLNGHQFAGSYGDNLKVRLPDEYDIIFYIKFPERSLIIVKEDHDMPGNVILDFTKVLEKIKREKQHELILKFIKKWLNENNYLRVEKFQSFLTSLFTNIMSHLEYRIIINGKLAILRYSRQGPAHTIHVNESFDIKYSVDFVPGILLYEKQNVLSNICGQWEAIPKPSYFFNPNYVSFRASYYRQEQELMNNKNDLKNVLRMVKKFRDSHSNMKKLKSYFIKTHFLWKAKQEDNNYWRKSLTFITIDIFKALEKSLREERLPYFWDQRLNLYDRYDSRLLREMLTCVEKFRETLEKAAQHLTLPLQKRVYKVFLDRNERNKLADQGHSSARNAKGSKTQLPENKCESNLLSKESKWRCAIL